ncbi:MAG: hypothetical protein V4436_03540 [Patescibacteria group bacterium]
MPQDKTELQKLFQRPEEGGFGEPQGEQAPEQEVIPEDLKNRHVRRLESKLQAEREANIAMAARIEALSEVEKFRTDTKAADWEENLARIYGSDTPEKAEATRLLIEGIKKATAQTKAEARDEMRQEVKDREAETEREVATLESYVEQIEDQYGVDLSSTKDARERRTQYFDLMEKLSPKRNGEIVDYADPIEVWEIFSARAPQSQAKTYAARSMAPSRGSVDENVDQNATQKWLMDQGII